MEPGKGLQSAAVRCLEVQADGCLRLGSQLENRGDPEQAAVQLQKALQYYDRLLQCTGDRTYGGLARECCTGLADCQMQLGNLHGADVYYVMALTYEEKKF